MADVLQVFEIYLKKMCGECAELRVNYEKLSAFVEISLGEAKFWEIVQQFVHTLQAMLKANTKSNTESGDDVCKDSVNEIESQPDKTSATNNERVDPLLVQITANKAEIDRRIAAFLKKKQLDVDVHNQREFCNLLNTENEYSCARVDAVFLPRVGQKSHITVTDAEHENEIMKSDNITVDTMLYSIPSKRLKTSGECDDLPYGVQERLDNMESHLKLSVKSVEYDVYSRIKKLEEKILYLEGLSPEYFNYKSASGYMASRRLTTNRHVGATEKVPSRYINDLDERMLKLRKKLLSEKVRRKSP